MIFVARGVMVSLAFFAVIYSFLSLLLALVWQVASRFRFVRLASGGLLFAFRVVPFVVSAVTALFLAFPSFLLMEGPAMDEDSGTFVLSACALLIVGAGLFRVLRAESETRRVVAAWLRGSTRLQHAGAEFSVVSPRNAAPITLVGLRTPRILVSESARTLLTEEELQAAIRHECQHQRSRDNLKKAAFNCIPFPGLGSLEHAWHDSSERDADDGAVSTRREALDLAAALVKLSRRAQLHATPAHAIGFVGATSSLGLRIERLLAWNGHPESSAKHWRYLVPLVLATVLVFVVKLGPALALIHSLTDRLVP